MRTLIAAASVTAAMLGAPAVARADTPSMPGPAIVNDVQFRVPEAQEARLKNGIRVLFVERHEMPIVSIVLSSSLGAADAAPGVSELAARLAVGSARGTHYFRTREKWNPSGAALTAFSDYRHCGVSARTLPPYLDETLANLAMISRATFVDSDDIRVARELAMDSITQAEQSSAFIAARAALYPPTHPYHFQESGTIEAMKSLSSDQLEGFWKRAFDASNMTIVAAGDSKLDTLTALLEKHFGAQPRSAPVTPAVVPEVTLSETRGILLVDRPTASQARIAVAGVGVARRHPQHRALRLAVAALDALLDQRIRKTYGSSYGVDASLSSERGPGPVWAFGAVENSGVGTALRTILDSIAEIGSGKMAPADFERVRAQMIAGDARAFETTQQTAGILSWATGIGLSLDDIRRDPEVVRAVTADQAAAAARTYLDPAKVRIVVVGDAKVLAPELEKLGLGKVEVRK